MFVSITSSRRLQEMSSRHLDNVFRVTIFCLPRRLEDEKLLRWRRVEDIFRKCLEDVFKTNKCLLGFAQINNLTKCFHSCCRWKKNLSYQIKQKQNKQKQNTVQTFLQTSKSVYEQWYLNRHLDSHTKGMFS